MFGSMRRVAKYYHFVKRFLFSQIQKPALAGLSVIPYNLTFPLFRLAMSPSCSVMTLHEGRASFSILRDSTHCSRQVKIVGIHHHCPLYAQLRRTTIDQHLGNAKTVEIGYNPRPPSDSRTLFRCIPRVATALGLYLHPFA